MTANFTKHAKKVTFSDAKAGDRVWSLTEGWGTILERFRSRAEYPLVVEFDNRSQKTYTLWGLLHYKDLNPALFWDEVKIETPEKPLPALEVDTKVLVWVDPEQKYKRHFSNFKNGQIYTFSRGRTSFTKLYDDSVIEWPNWELAE
ncbi:MAG TPA: hypothetical protein VL020_07035 [Pseudomonadales bacterium]|nr:hypothetical protein [Pseudomonadales bacterium]